jgi:hypothetical protein
MRSWPDDNGDAINRHVQRLRPRSRDTATVYRCILLGFQRFVQQRHLDAPACQPVIEAWLRDRALRWPMHLVLHRARVVDRFLDFLASEGSIPGNPLAQLRLSYGQRAGTSIVRALLSPDPAQALEALRPPPRFGSVLGGLMSAHIEPFALRSVPAGPFGSRRPAASGVAAAMGCQEPDAEPCLRMPAGRPHSRQGLAARRSARRSAPVRSAPVTPTSTATAAPIHLRAARSSALARDRLGVPLSTLSAAPAHAVHDAYARLLRRTAPGRACATRSG